MFSLVSGNAQLYLAPFSRSSWPPIRVGLTCNLLFGISFSPSPYTPGSEPPPRLEKGIHGLPPGSKVFNRSSTQETPSLLQGPLASPVSPSPRRSGVPPRCAGGVREWVPARRRPWPGSAPRATRVPGPASAGYLVIVQPSLQNLMQLPRQRVVGLRRGPAGPIAEAVGSPGRRDCDYFPATLGHSARVQPQARPRPPQPGRASTARAQSTAHAPLGRLCGDSAAQPGGWERGRGGELEEGGAKTSAWEGVTDGVGHGGRT